MKRRHIWIVCSRTCEEEGVQSRGWSRSRAGMRMAAMLQESMSVKRSRVGPISNHPLDHFLHDEHCTSSSRARAAGHCTRHVRRARHTMLCKSCKSANCVWGPPTSAAHRRKSSRPNRGCGAGRSAPESAAGLLRPAAMDRNGRPGWLPSMGFAFLSFNCGMAVYRSWDDPYTVAFVLAAYAALLLLFRCLHLLERRRDHRLKLAVWGLSTLLTLMFSYKVAAMMPPWAQLLVWAMGILTIVAGFYAFFVARPEEP